MKRQSKTIPCLAAWIKVGYKNINTNEQNKKKKKKKKERGGMGGNN